MVMARQKTVAYTANSGSSSNNRLVIEKLKESRESDSLFMLNAKSDLRLEKSDLILSQIFAISGQI